MPKTFTLGFSPCPNDTFIFDAMVNRKIDTGDIRFEVLMEDVETLNQWALEGRLDITKLSFPAFFEAIEQYVLLNAGSALGKGVGPVLISNIEHPTSNVQWVDDVTIAIPGMHTTANLLLSFAFPNASKKIPMIFSSIEDAVLEGKTELGVIIHENRFTYEQRGLKKVMDLGEYWENKMKVPIPLGGIAIKRNIDRETSARVEKLIKQSLEFAFEQYPTITDYVKRYSQSMDESVMRQHIDLYVNDYSLDLGDEGRKAILTLFEIHSSNQPELKLVPDYHSFFI